MNANVIQHVAKLVQTDIGSDADYPTHGSSIREIASEPVTQSNLRTQMSKMGRAIIFVEEQVKASQVGLDLDPSEKLSRIDVVEIDYDFSSQRWYIRVEIYMEDGNVTRTQLM